MEGNLAAGDVITCYQTDYESLVYFRTSDGREGIFSVNVSQIEPGDIESGECFEGLFFGSHPAKATVDTATPAPSLFTNSRRFKSFLFRVLILF